MTNLSLLFVTFKSTVFQFFATKPSFLWSCSPIQTTSKQLEGHRRVIRQNFCQGVHLNNILIMKDSIQSWVAKCRIYAKQPPSVFCNSIFERTLHWNCKFVWSQNQLGPVRSNFILGGPKQCNQKYKVPFSEIKSLKVLNSGASMDPLTPL